jgi:hypothetical protein
MQTLQLTGHNQIFLVAKTYIAQAMECWVGHNQIFLVEVTFILLGNLTKP